MVTLEKVTVGGVEYEPFNGGDIPGDWVRVDRSDNRSYTYLRVMGENRMLVVGSFENWELSH